MTHPLYVLLPADSEWTPVAHTTAQAPAQIRWYLRQHMPEATRSVAVLVDEDPATRASAVDAVLAQAAQLGGVVVDAATQQLADPATLGQHA